LRLTFGSQSCRRISRVPIKFWQREDSCHDQEQSLSASENRLCSNRTRPILSSRVGLGGRLSNCSNSAFAGWEAGLPPETRSRCLRMKIRRRFPSQLWCRKAGTHIFTRTTEWWIRQIERNISAAFYALANTGFTQSKPVGFRGCYVHSQTHEMVGMGR